MLLTRLKITIQVNFSSTPIWERASKWRMERKEKVPFDPPSADRQLRVTG